MTRQAPLFTSHARFAATICIASVLSVSVAEAGSAAGCNDYLSGNYQAAMQAFLPLAQKGNPESELAVGWLYDNGLGVDRDETAATKWYRRAANHGDARAEQYIATMYANGQGVAKDLRKAEHWFRLAAQSDNSGGQFGLGVMYRDGIVVSRDLVEAYKWFTLAMRSGTGTPEYDQAAAAQNALAQQMTADEFAKAAAAVAAWKPTRKSAGGSLCAK